MRNHPSTSCLAVAILVAVVLLGCRTEPERTDATDSASLFPIVQQEKWGFIDAAGTVVVEPQFDRAWPFSLDRALVRVGNRYGYIDRAGEVAIPAIYTDAWFFAGDLAPVEKDGKWVYIDRSGSVAVEPEFRMEASFLEEDGVPRPELGRVRIGDSYGYMNNVGDLVIEPQYNQAWNFVEGMARVRVDGKWGFINP
ncbi:MAG: WG repeat-containing protein, partial [Rhodothermales bacterium]|nr:WG repeat-containing protein [Rhodothermales bacterium]